MTPDEYIILAGKYCERMEWNHDAIPELAKCLAQHDLIVVLEFARLTMDNQFELEHENMKLREKVKNQAHRIRFFEAATNHAGGVPKVWRDAPCPHCSGTGNAGDWVASESALPNAGYEPHEGSPSAPKN